jgi:hypothetical protein
MKQLTAKLIILILFTSIIIKAQDTEMLQKKIDQFAPTELKYDSTLLSPRENIVLHKLYEASKIMDEIFLEQVFSKNENIQKNLMLQSSMAAKPQLEYFTMMAGPFDRLDHNKPFIGDYKKPDGANFYPEDMTKGEFQEFIKNNPDQEKAFTSEFTVIRRVNDKLTAIPFSVFYKDKLSKAAALLREAAQYADNTTLKNYLNLRAQAFETNDYYESDMAWMDLKDHNIEIVIGPYEVYEDELFNYKASFESFVTIKDPVESKKLDRFASYLGEMEEHLPIPEEYKNKERGSESPISVVNEVFTAGDTKAGVQTLAFNLPNDERVRKAKGSKKVMIKNLHEAKFEKLLIPIAKIVLPEDELKYVTFDGFFNHTLMHEMTHGIGPGFIKVNGRDTEVKNELKETYSKIEECKADILGMYMNIFMIEKGVFPKEFEKEIWVSNLAGIFRSVRFGINEAHGAGNAIIYNFLLEKGGYVYNDKTEKVSVDFKKVYPALEQLATKLLTIQATGDYDGANKLINQYAVSSPSMEILRNKLNSLPVDIKPLYQIEKN